MVASMTSRFFSARDHSISWLNLRDCRINSRSCRRSFRAYIGHVSARSCCRVERPIPARILHSATISSAHRRRPAGLARPRFSPTAQARQHGTGITLVLSLIFSTAWERNRRTLRFANKDQGSLLGSRESRQRFRSLFRRGLACALRHVTHDRLAAFTDGHMLYGYLLLAARPVTLERLTAARHG